MSQNMENNTPKQTSKIKHLEKQQVNLLVAYALWGLGFFGLCGIHRLYLRKPVSGLMWLFSYGFLFLGQILDLFLIPGMVEGNNRYVRRMSEKHPLLNNGQQVLDRLDRLDRILLQNLLKQEKPKPKPPSPMHRLLQAAAANGKVLSIGQAVMATGMEIDEVEQLLNDALLKGLAHVDNDPESGAVRYYFDI